MRARLFLGIVGEPQAIVTPDVRSGFPSYWWTKFFISHCSVLLGAFYLGLSGHVVPTFRSVRRVFLASNLYAAMAGALNWMFGTNYGYLAHKPAHPSLLDAFGPWPWYILGMEAVTLISLTLCCAPCALALWMKTQRT